MYSEIDSCNNLKSKAFDAYQPDLLGWKRFIKSNEIFWKKHMSNLAYRAKVTASSENPITEQNCAYVIDGVAFGYPYANDLFPLYKNEWASLGERAGAWIRLTWQNQIEVNRIILYDRPNCVDHIIRGALTFSDGSILKVGPLPNNGSAYIIDFQAKAFNWVQLTIDEAVGTNIGLSEFEIYI